MELLFESAHQPLKRCISRSNNHNAHVFAVEHCVGNDWQGRIAALLRNLSHQDDGTKMAAKRGIRRIILRQQADLLDEEKHQDLIRDIDKVLHSLFTPALRKQFDKNKMTSNFSIPKTSLWKGRSKWSSNDMSKGLNLTKRETNKIVDVSKQWIEALYPMIPQSEEGSLDQGNVQLGLFRLARRVRTAESGRQIGKPSGHDTISANSCVLMYVDPGDIRNKVLTSTRSAQARPLFFAVIAVFQRKEETPFAICLRCTKRGDCIQVNPSIYDNCRSVQLCRITPDVRRVAIYHNCDGDETENGVCQWDAHNVTLRHQKTLLQGGLFHFQTRGHGYPPRIA